MGDDKSLFGSREQVYTYTVSACYCENEVHKALEPILLKWISKGYSPREISKIIISAAIEMEAVALIGLRTGKKASDIKNYSGAYVELEPDPREEAAELAHEEPEKY